MFLLIGFGIPFLYRPTLVEVSPNHLALFGGSSAKSGRLRYFSDNMTRPYTSQWRTPPASATNLWLAIGDESGTFDNPRSSNRYGAELILACPSMLVGALHEKLNGETIRGRMSRPIEALGNWLVAKGLKKADELKRHSVREAWNYFKDRIREVTVQYSFGAKHSDRVLANRLGAFRWLATNEGVPSLGIYGTGKEVLTDFWKGNDPMAAIGALYSWMLALLRLFRGSSGRIRVYQGRSSKEINAASILCAGENVPAPLLGKNRQTTTNTGSNGAQLEAMDREL